MDNGRKAVIFAVGLFIILTIISAILLITNTGVKVSKDSSYNFAKTNKMLEDEYRLYDNTILYGEDVFKAIEKFKTSNLIVIAKDNKYYRNGGWVDNLSNTNITRKGNNYVTTAFVDYANSEFMIPGRIKYRDVTTVTIIGYNQICTPIYNLKLQITGYSCYDNWLDPIYEYTTTQVFDGFELVDIETHADRNRPYNSYLIKENDIIEGICFVQI